MEDTLRKTVHEKNPKTEYIKIILCGLKKWKFVNILKKTSVSALKADPIDNVFPNPFKVNKISVEILQKFFVFNYNICFSDEPTFWASWKDH